MFSHIATERLLPRLQILVYLGVSLFLVVIFFDQYMQGLYDLVLANMGALPALIFSSIFIYINRDNDIYRIVNLPLMVTLAILALMQLTNYKELMMHYLYALPLFSYFSLTLRQATIFNISLVAVMFLILLFRDGYYQAVRAAINLLLMVGSACCFAYLTQMKGIALRRLTLTESLSGAYNKRHYQQVLQREVARSHANHQSLSLIGIVIDEYQQILDLNGRPAVFSFLPTFTRRVRTLIRAEDEFFRIRDDLFVMLLPNCGEEGAIVLTERIDRKLKHYQWLNVGNISLTVAAITRHPQEDAENFEKRLLNHVTTQQRTSQQIAAFSE